MSLNLDKDKSGGTKRPWPLFDYFDNDVKAESEERPTAFPAAHSQRISLASTLRASSSNREHAWASPSGAADVRAFSLGGHHLASHASGDGGRSRAADVLPSVWAPPSSEAPAVRAFPVNMARPLLFPSGHGPPPPPSRRHNPVARAEWETDRITGGGREMERVVEPIRAAFKAIPDLWQFFSIDKDAIAPADLQNSKIYLTTHLMDIAVRLQSGSNFKNDLLSYQANDWIKQSIQLNPALVGSIMEWIKMGMKVRGRRPPPIEDMVRAAYQIGWQTQLMLIVALMKDNKPLAMRAYEANDASGENRASFSSLYDALIREVEQHHARAEAHYGALHHYERFPYVSFQTLPTLLANAKAFSEQQQQQQGPASKHARIPQRP